MIVDSLRLKLKPKFHTQDAKVVKIHPFLTNYRNDIFWFLIFD